MLRYAYYDNHISTLQICLGHRTHCEQNLPSNCNNLESCGLQMNKCSVGLASYDDTAGGNKRNRLALIPTPALFRYP
jgi:hypothetical protein